MVPRPPIAVAIAIAAGVAAFIALRLSKDSNVPLPHGHGDDGELIAFECGAGGAQHEVAIHFETGKEKIDERCSCAALANAMPALEKCCTNQAASAETACEDRASFDVNCGGAEAGGLAFSGPGNPTIRVSFFGGFTRSNWSCVDKGAANPDLEAMRKVYQRCCLQQ
jgi:hypothetical protein